jgi:predicted transcriptional regulator
MLVMTAYTSPAGVTIELDDDTIADLQALSHITRKHTNDLARQAIEQLRNTLVPSTREAPARAARKAKGATA